MSIKLGMERIKLEDVRKEVWKKLDSIEKVIEKIGGRGNKEAYLYPICTGLVKDCMDKGLEEKEYDIINKDICEFYRMKTMF